MHCVTAGFNGARSNLRFNSVDKYAEDDLFVRLLVLLLLLYLALEPPVCPKDGDEPIFGK